MKETGKENQETLIFIHGENMAGWMWDEQVKAFPDFHCIIPDLPEHGNSNDVAPFTIKEASEQIIEIIKDYTYGKANLVGISLGAQVILQILNDAPRRVCSAFISGALVNKSQPSDIFLELFNYLIDAYIPIKNHPLSIGSYIRSYGIPKSQRKKYIKSTRVVKPDSAREILKENILFKMPDKLEEADVPVMLMAGEKDYTIIKESVEVLANILPNSKAFLAPGVGHFWNMEKPELFNEVLKSWITGNSLPNDLIKI